MANGNIGCARGNTQNNKTAVYRRDGRLLVHGLGVATSNISTMRGGRRAGTVYYNSSNADWKGYDVRGRLRWYLRELPRFRWRQIRCAAQESICSSRR
jgi:hypothetical protein